MAFCPTLDHKIFWGHPLLRTGTSIQPWANAISHPRKFCAEAKDEYRKFWEADGQAHPRLEWDSEGWDPCHNSRRSSSLNATQKAVKVRYLLLLLLLYAELPHKFLILNSNRWQWEGVRNVWSMICSHCSRSSSNQHFGEYLHWGLHLTFVLDWFNQPCLPYTFLPFSWVKISGSNALNSDDTLL